MSAHPFSVRNVSKNYGEFEAWLWFIRYATSRI